MEVELGEHVVRSTDKLLTEEHDRAESSAPWSVHELQGGAHRDRRQLPRLLLVVGLLAVAVILQAVVILRTMGAHATQTAGLPERTTAFAFRDTPTACSGHGVEYSYGVREGPTVWCECLNCFSGRQCQVHDAVRGLQTLSLNIIFNSPFPRTSFNTPITETCAVQTCDAQASAGDPLMFEEYWATREGGAGDVLLQSAHKMGYVLSAEAASSYSTTARLEVAIREVSIHLW
jgi:hypothetical protein